MGKIRYGISNVHVALISDDGNGNITYSTPFAVKGAVSLSIDPEGGDSTPFYADNIVWYKSPEVNNGYTGELELAVTPAKFLTDVLGQVEDSADDGILYELANATSARFALLFQAEGDQYHTRYCFYDCTATRPSRDNETKEDTITPGTETISISMTPRVKDSLVKAQIDEETAEAANYAAWFTSVKLPTQSL